MRNNKGITLITVVVMIIIIIIIATTSIIAGSKLMTNSRTLVTEQNLEAVRQAIRSRKAEVDMQGTITPLGEELVGKLSPMIAGDQIEATDWYLLNEDYLLELGVKDLKARFLVNYDKSVVISLEDENYIVQYLNYVFIDKIKEQVRRHEIDDYVGIKLKNHSASEAGTMYVDHAPTAGSEIFGTGWYVVSSSDFITAFSSDYSDTQLQSWYQAGENYLVNYDDYKYVKITGTMKAE